jgi:hypothetical protein
MPDKPLWLARLSSAIEELEANPDPWVHRAMIESLLGVGRRRAQQLLAPIAKRVVGTSVVAERADVIAHLKGIASGEVAWYEGRRRERLWAQLDEVRRAWSEQPPVLVEVSDSELRKVELHDIEGLPEGVELAPGTIILRFSEPEEALRKLMALAVAISHNRQAFDDRVAVSRSSAAERGGA